MPEDVWTTDALGILTSGSKRDRVNAELFRAIGTYRKAVEKFKMGDMAGNALHRIGVIYTKYLTRIFHSSYDEASFGSALTGR